MFMPGFSVSSLTFAENDSLIGGLLGVTRHQHRPARVKRGIKIVVTAMDIQRVLRQRSGADFEDHGREFARRVVILLHRVNDSLAGSEVDRALASDRERRGAALRSVFAFAFDGDLRAAENVQFPLRVGPLVNLAAFGRWRDGIEDAAVGDARLDVLRDELVPVASDCDAGVFRLRAIGAVGGGICLQFRNSGSDDIRHIRG
jgi:hypothetical protein